MFEPRLGATYQLNEKTIVRASGGIFHNRVTLNDSTLLGGNPPFQPQVTVSNGSVDNPSGGTVGSATLPFGINGQDPVFKHPTSYMWGIGIQREIPLGFTLDVTYIGRRGNYLQRERNINQLQAGTLPNSANIAALRPYKGYNVIRVSENSGSSKYNSLQVSADRRYKNGLKVGFAYTLGKSEDNASNKRTVLWNTYDDTKMWGASDFDRRHVASVYYIYELPFMRDQSTLMRNLLGGWQVSGATFFRTGTPFAVLRNDDAAGVGDGGFLQPANLVGDVNAGREQGVLDGRRRRQLLVQPRGIRQAGGGHLRQLAPEQHLQSGRAAVGHRALQELHARRHPPCTVPRGVLQLPEPPELGERPDRCPPGAGLGESEQRQLRARRQQAG